jgi:hypothetical protein
MSDPNECVARYEYDGLFRRIEKTVANQGTGLVPDSDDDGTITSIQAGDRHEHYYWGGMGVSPVNWRLVEARDGSDRTLGQYVWGVQYLDEPVRYDRNTDVGTDNDCVEAADRSYFYHQDANYRVVMLTDEDGNVVERVAYTAYGAPTVYGGYSSTAGGIALAGLTALLVWLGVCPAPLIRLIQALQSAATHGVAADWLAAL